MSRVLIGSMIAVRPRRDPIGGPAQIVDIDALALALVRPSRPQPRHRVHERALRRLGVADRGIDPVAELLLAAGQRGEAALAAGPIAGGGVEQRQRKAILLEPLGDGLRRMIIGEEELDRLEPGPRRRLEPVEKIDVLEHHAQIGGEFRHRRRPLFAGGATDGYCCPGTGQLKPDAPPQGRGRRMGNEIGRMTHIRGALSAAAAMVMLLCGAASARAEEPIKIGFSMELTGAVCGRRQDRAARLPDLGRRTSTPRAASSAGRSSSSITTTRATRRMCRASIPS